MRAAILDLGTNTFNLFIAEKEVNGTINPLHSNELPVKLGRGGINQFTIKEDAWHRGLKALQQHKESILKYKAGLVKGFATSAIRSATNGKELIETINNDFGFTIEIIDGYREAELIYSGVKNAVNLPLEPVLILDIGGGSNEFVIARHEKILWTKSYNLGMARIIERFNLDDPVSEINIQDLEEYFESELSDLFGEIEKHDPHVLIGSAGTFNTFISMLNAGQNTREKKFTVTSHTISMNIYRDLHRKLIRSATTERLKMKGLPEMRVEMIVPATIFVNFIIRKCNISTFIQSAYSLKEGAFFELTEN